MTTKIILVHKATKLWLHQALAPPSTVFINTAHMKHCLHQALPPPSTVSTKHCLHQYSTHEALATSSIASTIRWLHHQHVQCPGTVQSCTAHRNQFLGHRNDSYVEECNNNNHNWLWSNWVRQQRILRAAFSSPSLLNNKTASSLIQHFLSSTQAIIIA